MSLRYGADFRRSRLVWNKNVFWTRMLHRGEAVLRKHLRRKLRTFEENQKSNIIRTTKGKRTLLLKFRQFYSAKNTRRDTHESRKPFSPNTDIACWAWKNLILRQKLFILKNLTMPKTVKGARWDLLKSILLQNFSLWRLWKISKKTTFLHSFCCKISKIEGRAFGDIRKFSEVSQRWKKGESHSAEKVRTFYIGILVKKISVYARVRTRNPWVEKQASYH